LVVALRSQFALCRLNPDEAKLLELLLKKAGMPSPAATAEEEEVVEETYFSKLQTSGNKAKTFGSLYKSVFKPNTAQVTVYMSAACTDTDVEPYTVRQTSLFFNRVCFTPAIAG
jgi:hypothetical protein